ncbi:MAG: ADP-ribose pyrophosphatase [Chloroflexota bacterium]|nr:MAG: ADP-ribose pyrophosphatase [Chloroflexota bacterium]
MSKTEAIAVRLLHWGNTIKAIAQTGLSFTTDYNDKLRYEDLLDVATEILASVNDNLQFDAKFAQKLAQTLRRETHTGVVGYITPKVSVAAAVFDENDRILLVKGNHSKSWSLPGGWAEERWSPAENAQREVLEETGLIVKARHLLGVFDSRLHPFETSITSYTLLFECQKVGGELNVFHHEIEEAKFFSDDRLPKLITGATKQIRVVFAFHKGQPDKPYFDQ